jgi:hypothetical protein
MIGTGSHFLPHQPERVNNQRGSKPLSRITLVSNSPRRRLPPGLQSRRQVRPEIQVAPSPDPRGFVRIERTR